MVIGRVQFLRWIKTPKFIRLAQRSITLMWLFCLERSTARETSVHGRTFDSHLSYFTSKGPPRSMLSAPTLTMVLGVLVLAPKLKR